MRVVYCMPIASPVMINFMITWLDYDDQFFDQTPI